LRGKRYEKAKRKRMRRKHGKETNASWR